MSTKLKQQSRWARRGSLQRGPSSVSAASSTSSSKSSLRASKKLQQQARQLSQYPPGTRETEGRTNGWSLPPFDGFRIRGANYLKDKKKVPSQDFLFQLRGAEVFLTDSRPQNVAQEPGILGGRLRDVPSFVLNFRLPWGVLVCCFEIPQRFVPFVECAYSSQANKDAEKRRLVKAMDTMTPGDRCVCRFLLGDETYKNQALKVVPVVVKGPWVAQKAAGGKPAILGKALPSNYVYQPAEDGGSKALYLEADLDICASAAARRILGVAKSCTRSLTLDLGFVVEGKQEDELPEQMLMAFRLHSLDPDASPLFPPPAPEPVERDGNENKERLTSSLSSRPAKSPDEATQPDEDEETRSILTQSSLSFDENNYSAPFVATDKE